MNGVAADVTSSWRAFSHAIQSARFWSAAALCRFIFWCDVPGGLNRTRRKEALHEPLFVLALIVSLKSVLKFQNFRSQIRISIMIWSFPLRFIGLNTRAWQNDKPGVSAPPALPLGSKLSAICDWELGAWFFLRCFGFGTWCFSFVPGVDSFLQIQRSSVFVRTFLALGTLTAN